MHSRYYPVGARLFRLIGFASRSLVSTLLLSLLLPLTIFSQPPPADVTVRIGVGDTILVVEGLTAPLSNVTILSNGSVIGTTAANAEGEFSQTFNAQDHGLRSLKVYSRDSAGRLTDTVTKNVNVVEHAETTVHFFLPPSIYLADTNLTEGQQLLVRGESAPDAKIIVRLDNNLNLQTKASNRGRWQLIIDTAGFFEGTHSLFALAQTADGAQSQPTAKRLFKVSSGPTPIPPPPPPASYIPPPVIVSPANNYHATDRLLELKGTADANIQIEIWDGQTIIGSTFSNHLGEWSFSLNLTKSRYLFRAKACAGQRCSSFSNSVNVIFAERAPTEPEYSFSLRQYRYFGIYQNQPITLDIFASSLPLPFDLIVDFGDDTVLTSSVDQAGPISLPHTYGEIGHYNGIVSIQTADGQIINRYFSVEVIPEPAGLASKFLLIIGLIWTYLVTSDRLLFKALKSVRLYQANTI